MDYIWLTPFFKSPQKDNGYDVADYTSVDPAFGTMDDVKELIREADRRGIGCMFDMVFNHTTGAPMVCGPWPGEAGYMDYYIFRDEARLPAYQLAIQVRRKRLGVRAPLKEVVSPPVRCEPGGLKLG